MDKAWVWLPRNSLEYEAGATKFVVESASNLGNPSEMFCPCLLCRNVCHQSMDTVVEHLVIKGMDQKYKRSKCWSLHGDIMNEKTPNVDSSENEAYELFRTAFMATEGTQPSQQQNVDEVEDIDSQEDFEFRKKLEDAETPLYSTCQNYTKVAAIMGLYRIKVKSGMSENYFDQLLMLIHDMLPGDNVMPKSTDDIKKFLKLFGFGYDVIHACKNDCILYRNQYEKLVNCPRCSESRWEKDKHTGEEKKGIPAKVLRYFPIKDRFRRMFRSKRLAEGLRWHFTNASDDGSMRHPVDSLTWSQVNNKWPEFAADSRNLRLGLSTDGMNPFSIQNTKYSTWPVFLVNYNMAPTECMKAENIMLTLLIPGPTAPSNNIDVYLQPLIDDLKDLWTEGMKVYDSFAKESFNLRAILLWTITDYPALGTVAGCKVKGKQACNVCGKDTPHRWLKFSRKHVYMGNRKRLRPGHPYRRKKHWFDNTVESGTVNRIQSGAEIFESLKDFRNDFGRPLDKKGKRRKRDVDDEDVISAEEYEEDNVLWRWKKRSILFDLPYWKYMLVRHNIDVMHVEKNVSDALLSILMHSVKSKDGLKARQDLEDIGIRTNLHPEVRGKRTYLPPAAYWLSKEEKRKFCKRLSKFRGPDGYCANIANCVSVDPPNIGSLKSHDHHVLMQNLLPVTLRGLLPKGPRIAVSRLCNYFSRLCQRVIDPEKLVTLESEVVETMCQLERFFPPSLFDIMFHLPIHLAREARLGGPVHFRWMYPFERYMKTLKAYVKNFARPEACMAEGYLAGECISFCMEFLKKSVPVQEAINRNEDIEADSYVAEGRPLQKGTEVKLTDKERDIAHRYILMNTAVMDPYIQLHLEELQSTDVRCAKNETLLWKYHTEKFPQWIKEKIPTNSIGHSTRLRWLAFGPRSIAQTYKGYIINGHRFHTDDVKRKTQNSGVTYEAFSMCRASAKDTRQTADIVVFYGVIKEIILLDYHMFQVPLFKCIWANKGNGLKEEDGFTLVNLHMKQSAFLNDPFIMPSQAKQVFYSREDDSSPCKRQQGQDVTPVPSLPRKRQKKPVIEENEGEKSDANFYEEEDQVNRESLHNGEDIGSAEEVEAQSHRVQDEQIPASTTNGSNPSEAQTQQSEIKKKKTRGPTKLRKVAKNADEKLEVEFNAIGAHVGKGSAALSSFLGILVREHVPVLLDDWRHLDANTKDRMWEEVQGRFNLNEVWHKEAILGQMNHIWRSSKSKLVTKVRATKSKVEIQQIRPSNIPSTSDWNAWVKKKTSTAFKEKSETMSKLRKSQIPQTTSRKGFHRLANEMKQKAPDPSKVTRSKVWIAGHTHADGRPVRPEFEETIEKIKSIDSEMDSTSTNNIREDAARDSHVKELEAKLEKLQTVVSDLAAKQSNDVSKSGLSDVSKGGIRCQLLDWCSKDDIVVGEGEYCSCEPTYKIGRIPIGRNAAAVLVNSVSVIGASLWRPTQSIGSLGEAVGVKIPWPSEKIILDDDYNFTEPHNTDRSEASDGSIGRVHRVHIYDYWNVDTDVIAEGILLSTDPKEMVNNAPLGPNDAVINVDKVVKPGAYLWRPTMKGSSLMGDALNEIITWPADRIQIHLSTLDESTKKSSPLQSGTNSTGTSKGSKKNCFLLDCDNSGEQVAIGRVCSTDPEDKVHLCPLGPNASKIWVEVSKIDGARVWRPNSEIQVISDAVGNWVAWPNKHIVFM
ncbi:Transposase-associated domain [Arabidopsis thaliana x Arabidopsis arenosa]|uniref:Transposase-associated domain n=1 Tax=Arabidopsis thaliana x Arabidopsis arenosa TaxID=1240361 RepID=A0A8T1Y634_9BRAS|nr:Transposase-associated domain [Arabidopsis thaliana x Arabidopsis arenosa]